jgi:hypothetical protein
VSTVLGTPAGMIGSAVFHSVAGRSKFDETSPTSNRQRIPELRAAAVDAASDSVAATSVRARITSSSGQVAGAESALGQIERLPVGRFTVPRTSARSTSSAQRQIGLRHPACTSSRVLCSSLRAIARRAAPRVGRARKLAEDELVARIRAGSHRSERVGPSVPLTMPLVRAALAPMPTLRKLVGACRVHQRSRLLEARRGDADARVVPVGALDQRVEHRVGECFPPFAARLALRGCRECPAAIAFLELRRRHGQLRSVDRRGCGGTAREDERECDARKLEHSIAHGRTERVQSVAQGIAERAMTHGITERGFHVQSAVPANAST